MNTSHKKISIKKIFIIGAVTVLGITFIPNSANAVEAPLNLGTAGTYGVLASSTITNATASSVSGTAGGNIGIAGGTAATGLITFSGAQILAGTSVAALASAANALADVRASTALGVEIGAGTVLTPGSYSGGSFQMTGALTLDGAGNPNSVFILRAASTLVTSVGSSVTLINGAQACNVFWQIGSSATLGTSSRFVGHLIAQASISTGATSTVNGQLIAVSGAVTLGGTTILNDSCAAPVVVTTPAPVVSAVPVVAPAVIATPVAYVAPATLRIVKIVINTHTGVKSTNSFVIHVKQDAADVAGSPVVSSAAPGNTFTLVPGDYQLSEDRAVGYRGVWSGPISDGGRVTLVSGETLTVTRTNYDMVTETIAPVVDATPTPTPAATPTPSPTETTFDGGVLPNTATPWGNTLLLGGVLVLLGIAGFGSRKLIARR